MNYNWVLHIHQWVIDTNNIILQLDTMMQDFSTSFAYPQPLSFWVYYMIKEIENAPNQTLILDRFLFCMHCSSSSSIIKGATYRINMVKLQPNLLQTWKMHCSHKMQNWNLWLIIDTFLSPFQKTQQSNASSHPINPRTFSWVHWFPSFPSLSCVKVKDQSLFIDVLFY